MPFGYNLEETQAFKNLILEKLSDYNFPILFNVNIGHCDPIITVPIGTQIELDSSTNKFKFLQSAVK